MTSHVYGQAVAELLKEGGFRARVQRYTITDDLIQVAVPNRRHFYLEVDTEMARVGTQPWWLDMADPDFHRKLLDLASSLYERERKERPRNALREFFVAKSYTGFARLAVWLAILASGFPLLQAVLTNFDDLGGTLRGMVIRFRQELMILQGYSVAECNQWYVQLLDREKNSV